MKKGASKAGSAAGMGGGSAPARRNLTPWACAGLFAAVLAAYWPTLQGSLIWDDDAHVTKPALRSLHGLWRIWFEVGATQQYYPVLHSAFWIEHLLWGDATLGYHLTNLVLHATAACLFALALRRLWKREDAAWLAAFLFALHPVGVETVAWISEQKNTLSAVFYLLSALVYLRWRAGVGTGGPPVRAAAESKADTDGRAARPHLYFLALGLFVLAVLSKSVTVTLPAALLVILWWQRGSLGWKRDIVPLLPWFIMGAGAGLFTAWVERKYIGAEGAVFTLSFLQRCLLAGRAGWFYLGKLVWPVDLIFVYPHWTVDVSALSQWLFPLAALAVIVALAWLSRRTRGPLAGALFFLGTLFPALGFFNVYPFRFSYVADHFQYLASLGIIALAAAAWTKVPGLYFLNRDRDLRSRGPAPLLSTVAANEIPRYDRNDKTGGPAPWWPAAVAIAVLGLLGGLTWRQSGLYRDPETLYRATLDRNPGAWLAHNNLGVILADAHRLPEAAEQFQETLRLEPGYADAERNLGLTLAREGRWAEAIPHYEQALRLQPDFVNAHDDFGNTLLWLNRPADAVAQFEQSVALSPDDFEAQCNLGLALVRTNRLAEATPHFEAAVRLEPDNAGAHNYLAHALRQTGRLPEAVAQFAEVVRLRPEDARARSDLADARAALQSGAP
jgi:tetratricopeptide (TPR) repeat protein